MKLYEITHEALKDLEEIADYITKDSPARAKALIDKLYKAMEQIAKYPEIGHTRPELKNEKIKFWPVGNYLICYQKNRKFTKILRVLSGYRNLTALFGY